LRIETAEGRVIRSVKGGEIASEIRVPAKRSTRGLRSAERGNYSKKKERKQFPNHPNPPPPKHVIGGLPICRKKRHSIRVNIIKQRLGVREMRHCCTKTGKNLRKVGMRYFKPGDEGLLPSELRTDK